MGKEDCSSKVASLDRNFGDLGVDVEAELRVYRPVPCLGVIVNGLALSVGLMGCGIGDDGGLGGLSTGVAKAFLVRS